MPDESHQASAVISVLFAKQAEDVAYLWPDNVATWQHWCNVQSQWRYAGMGGRTGMDYAGVRAYLDECGIEGDERRDIFAGIRAAEGGTLQALGEIAQRDRKN